MCYTIKLKNLYKIFLIAFPVIVLVLIILFYLTYGVKEDHFFYYGIIVGFIVVVVSKTLKNPKEIQKFDTQINFKNFFGNDNFVPLKEFSSYEERLIYSYFVTKKEKILIYKGFEELPKIIKDIKKYNSQFNIFLKN